MYEFVNVVLHFFILRCHIYEEIMKSIKIKIHIYFYLKSTKNVSTLCLVLFVHFCLKPASSIDLLGVMKTSKSGRGFYKIAKG